MPSLKDFKIVDLKRSVWDRENADLGKGKYRFSEKHYLKNSDYDDATVRPDHVLTWVRYDKINDFIEFRMWENQLSAETVKAGDKLYWPEPLAPKPDGSYVWQDAILVQVPLEVWLTKRKEDHDRYEREAKRNKSEFAAIAQEAGAVLEMEDDVIQKIGV